jgi:hypothetical protein
MIMCERTTGTVRARFDIASDDLAAVLRLARREGVTSAGIYRRAVAEYLVNHADLMEWPIGDGIGSEVRGSAPMNVTQDVPCRDHTPHTAHLGCDGAPLLHPDGSDW